MARKADWDLSPKRLEAPRDGLLWAFVVQMSPRVIAVVA